jgi:hypothetical protein
MAFPSHDNLISNITEGNYVRVDHSKLITPAQVAGGWFCLAALAGSPITTTFPQTNPALTGQLVFTTCDGEFGDGTGGGFGVYNGGLPGGTNGTTGITKHLLNIGAMCVAAAGAPWQAKLVDLQGYYKFDGSNGTSAFLRTCINANAGTFSTNGSGGLVFNCTNNFRTYTKVKFTTPETMPIGMTAGVSYWTNAINGTSSNIARTYADAVNGVYVAAEAGTAGTACTMMVEMPRYANGEGCQAFVVVTVAPTTGPGTMGTSNYDNTTCTAGAGTSRFQGTPIMLAAANATLTRIPHSGNAAGCYGPFLPLQGGDKGIARINSFHWTGSYTGTNGFALCIAKPLMDIALPVTGMWCERDLVNQLPSMPQIKDGACLVWLLFATGATTNLGQFQATADFAWGDGS